MHICDVIPLLREATRLLITNGNAKLQVCFVDNIFCKAVWTDVPTDIRNSVLALLD